MKAVTARGGAPALREGVDGSALDAPESGQAALRGGAVRSAGYVLGLLLSLVAAPLLIRHLGVVDFGRYTTVVTLAILIGGATEAGLNVIALREYSPRSAAERSWIMRNLIGVRLTLTAAGVALGVAFALVAGYDSVMVIGVVATGAGLMMQALQTLLSMVLQGEL